MQFKSFKPKKKIICRILATILIINFFGMSRPILAMVGDDSEPVPIRVTAANPFINVPDEDGWTLLMRAIQDHDPEFVKKLLEEGADLNIMPPEIGNHYSNGLEYLCDLVIRTFAGKWVDGEYENKIWLISQEVRQSYYDIFDIIIQYFIDHNMPLSVNMDKLKNHDDTMDTLWDLHGKWQYWEKMYEYPHLFT